MEPQSFHPDSNHAPKDNVETVTRPTIEPNHIKPNHLGRPRRAWGRYIFTAIVLIGLAVAGWYGYRYINTINQSKTELSEQVQALKSDTARLQNELNSNKTPASTQGQDNVVVFKELGVQIRPDISALDIVYVYSKEDTGGVAAEYADLTTRRLMGAANSDVTSGRINANNSMKCGPGWLGAIVRQKTAITGGDPKLTKKIGDYYYAYAPPQNLCSENKSVQDIEKAQIELLRNAFATIEAIK